MLFLRLSRVNEDFVTFRTAFETTASSCLEQTAPSEALHEFFARLLALFRRHLRPVLHHAPAPPSPGPATAASAKSSKENFAEDEHPDCLPIGDGVQSEKIGHEPVPQPHDEVAEQEKEHCHHHHDGQNFHNFSHSS